MSAGDTSRSEVGAPKPRARFVFCVTIALLWLGVVPEAKAYQCSRATGDGNAANGPSLSWFTRDVSYFRAGSGTEDIEGSNEWIEIDKAFLSQWEAVIQGRSTDLRRHRDQ